MANMVDLIMRLERRLIAVENAVGIKAGTADLIHPKALAQADAKIEVEKAELFIKEK
jgi:hypothetical protein